MSNYVRYANRTVELTPMEQRLLGNYRNNNWSMVPYRSQVNRTSNRTKTKTRPKKRKRPDVSIPLLLRKRTKYPKRMLTKGYTHKKFRKAKKWKANRFLKSGYVRHVERGNVVSAARCAYIGHGVAADQLTVSICNFLVRKLFSQAGVQINCFDSKVQDYGAVTTNAPGSIGFSYQLSDESACFSHQFQIAQDSTFGALATGLRNNFYLTSTRHPGVTIENMIFRELWWHNDLNDNHSSRSRIDLTNLVLDIQVGSYLTLQNRTLAGVAAGTDQSSMLDVANNPIEGRKYTGKGNGTTLRFNNKSAVNPGLRTNIDTGVITFDPDSPDLSVEMKTMVKRPPQANAFTKQVRQVGAQLNPGAIRKDKLMMKVKMYFNTWASIFKEQFSNALEEFVDFGRFSLFAFEKKCNTEVDEPNISIGYEINAYYSVTGFVRRVGVTVVNDAI